MELDSFVRFRARGGEEEAFAEELRTVVTASRAEAGCVQIEAFRGTRDRRLFYIHSRWVSEEAFAAHAKLAHTVKFLRRAEELLEDPVEAVRTERIA
ncbi:MAG: antibiotic biosynthesis monooxygenase [Candidatus Acidiferrum sp.]